MVLFSRYFNGGLLVTRTIHVVAAELGSDVPRQQIVAPVNRRIYAHTTLCPSALS